MWYSDYITTIFILIIWHTIILLYIFPLHPQHRLNFLAFLRSPSEETTYLKTLTEPSWPARTEIISRQDSGSSSTERRDWIMEACQGIPSPNQIPTTPCMVALSLIRGVVGVYREYISPIVIPSDKGDQQPETVAQLLSIWEMGAGQQSRGFSLPYLHSHELSIWLSMANFSSLVFECKPVGLLTLNAVYVLNYLCIILGNGSFSCLTRCLILTTDCLSTLQGETYQRYVYRVPLIRSRLSSKVNLQVRSC